MDVGEWVSLNPAGTPFFGFLLILSGIISIILVAGVFIKISTGINIEIPLAIIILLVIILGSRYYLKTTKAEKVDIDKIFREECKRHRQKREK